MDSLAQEDAARYSKRKGFEFEENVFDSKLEIKIVYARRLGFKVSYQRMNATEILNVMHRWPSRTKSTFARQRWDDDRRHAAFSGVIASREVPGVLSSRPGSWPSA